MRIVEAHRQCNTVPILHGDVWNCTLCYMVVLPSILSPWTGFEFGIRLTFGERTFKLLLLIMMSICSDGIHFGQDGIGFDIASVNTHDDTCTTFPKGLVKRMTRFGMDTPMQLYHENTGLSADYAPQIYTCVQDLFNQCCHLPFSNRFIP